MGGRERERQRDIDRDREKERERRSMIYYNDSEETVKIVANMLE